MIETTVKLKHPELLQDLVAAQALLGRIASKCAELSVPDMSKAVWKKVDKEQSNKYGSIVGGKVEDNSEALEADNLKGIPTPYDLEKRIKHIEEWNDKVKAGLDKIDARLRELEAWKDSMSDLKGVVMKVIEDGKEPFNPKGE